MNVYMYDGYVLESDKNIQSILDPDAYVYLRNYFCISLPPFDTAYMCLPSTCDVEYILNLLLQHYKHKITIYWFMLWQYTVQQNIWEVLAPSLVELWQHYDDKIQADRGIFPQLSYLYMGHRDFITRSASILYPECGLLLRNEAPSHTVKPCNDEIWSLISSYFLP